MNRLINPHLRIFFCLLALASCLLSAAMISRIAHTAYMTEVSANLSKQKIIGYSTDISVQLKATNKAPVNLHAGRALLTNYMGRSAAATEALRNNQVEALALTSEDFDEDGVKDIIAAYASNDGGIITLQRGNVDAIYPNAPEAQERKAAGEFTDAPFFAEARVFELAQRPDFIGAGDFDADGHQDLVVASAGGNTLNYLSGDGRGNFSSVNLVELPGRVTALECAEVNRRDGLLDVVVGIVGSTGAKALVFASPFGARLANAESLDLPTEATSFAMTNLDGDYAIDLAIAAGRELLIVRGRDRRLSLNQAAQTRVESLQIDRRVFGKKILSVIGGDFSSTEGRELALLTDDGSVLILEKAAVTKRSSRNIKQLVKGYFPTATRLIGARVSSERTDSLLALDSAKRQIHIISTSNISLPHEGTNIPAQFDPSSVWQLDVDAEPVAALPLRLNADSLSDLVILRRRQSAITVTPSAPQTVFQVLTEEDAGGGSLREAITMANASPGPDEITFNLDGPVARTINLGGGVHTINLLSPLPAITDSLTIDATTQSGFMGQPIVELNYSAAGLAQAGLVINAATCTIRGLVINRVQGMLLIGHGIEINNSEITIEGNFIGTNLAGNAASPNAAFGINIPNADSIIIGGTTPAARNVISGNLAGGINITGAQSDLITVAGNFIGTDAAGTDSITTADGVTISALATNNTIGGTTAAERNLISGNISGVVISASGNLVQGNFIGVDVTGNADLGNIDVGVRVADSLGNMIGGVTNGASNIISGNDNAGIFLIGAGNTIIQNNSIGINISGTAMPNINVGVQVSSADSNTIGGPGAGNVIAFNGAGVAIPAGTGNAILANSIFSNAMLGINLSDDQVTPNDVGDVDAGANNLQNFPVLTSANQETASTRVQGTLESMPSTQYRVEFFSSPNCDASGNGEGQTFLGSTMVTTNNTDGTGNFDVLLPFVPAGQVITATATDPANNTSEFSQCILVVAGPGPGVGTADLSIRKTAAPAQVLAGGLITYTITVINFGPDQAANVVIDEFTPTNTTFRSLNAPPGWNCNTPQIGGVGHITCTNPVVIAGEPHVFTLVVRVNSPISNGADVRNTVKITSTTPDQNLNNNAASATVIVINSCNVTCPTSITRNSDANQCGTTVTYAAPTTNGSCGTVNCTPASGSFFQRGTTIVNCSTNSGPGCSFSVIVNDVQAPTISCPANVSAVENPTGSGVAVVNYPLPTTNDNCQGVTPVCTPPAGSIFPVGSTTVTCTATDAGGNQASCSFNVMVQGGPPVLLVTIAGGKPNLEFGSNSPVSPRRKPAKEKNNPCSIFTVENRGFIPVEIILDSIVRTGTDVNGSRIGNANEGDLFSLRRLNSAGGEVGVVPVGGRVLIGIGERVDFCLKFNPLLPIVTTSTTGVPASLVLPDILTSRVTFRVTGGNPFSVNIVANVAGDLVLIDPNNTRRPPVITFERIGNEYVLTFSLFDANLDVQRMKVELLDSSGRVVIEFEIDLVVPVRERNLVRGQSFTVVQRFSGANDNPEVTAVRVTVSDRLNSVSGTANLSSSSAQSLVVSASESQSGVVLPRLRIRPEKIWQFGDK
jgi:uncharacterized repeat protein (TIGR01451 family)